MAQARVRPPTPRMVECFDTYARVGSAERAAHELAISIQQLRHNVGEHNRRLGANSSIQAAFIRWAPKEDKPA